MEWEGTSTLWSFSECGWTYQDRQTEQLEAKLGAVEDINYLIGAALPLRREGKGEKKSSHIQEVGLGLNQLAQDFLRSWRPGVPSVHKGEPAKGCLAW